LVKYRGVGYIDKNRCYNEFFTFNKNIEEISDAFDHVAIGVRDVDELKELKHTLSMPLQG